MIIQSPPRKPVSNALKRPAAEKLPPPPEKYIQQSIVDYLRRVAGCFVQVNKEHYSRDKYHRGIGAFCDPGTPDLMVCKDGITFYLEVKRPGSYGKMRESQVKWHKEYQFHGGLVWVVRSIEDVKDVLAELAVIEQNRRRCGCGSSVADR